MFWERSVNTYWACDTSQFFAIGLIKILALCAGHWWLAPVILVTLQAEIRRIRVQSQPRKIVLENNKKHKNTYIIDRTKL
jgi:hypothetical protein